MSSLPKLSVHIVTYNHAPFIGQTLDSVLMQQVCFDYEIIVADDCSTDGTIEIIKDYHRRWPHKIKPTFREKNVGAGRNAVEALEKCRGEYVACLEGDDYWTDPDKLRLQVEYLDKHPGCALVHHAVAHMSWPSGESLGICPALPFRIERTDPRLIAMVNYIQTCAVMFRKKCLPPLDDQYQGLKLGDWPLFALLSQNGWIGYIDRSMAHYRIHACNNWNNRPADYKMAAMEEMARYLLERVNERSREHWKNTILALAFKDVVLSMKSLDFLKSFVKVRRFASNSVKFKKPFWLLNSLWPYYRANSAARSARKLAAPNTTVKPLIPSAAAHLIF